MDKEIEKILESIEFDEKEAWLFETRQKVLTATADNAEQIIKEISFWEKSYSVGRDHFEYQPYYFFFQAYLHEVSGNHDDAIDRAARAISLFHMRDFRWNEAMLHWFISIVERARSREEEACKHMQSATAILEGMARGFQQEGRRGDCQDCQELLRELYRRISLSKPFEDVIIQNDIEQHLLLSAVPFYDSVSSKMVETDNKDNKKKGNEKDKSEKVDYEWESSLGDSFMKIPLGIIGNSWFAIKPIHSSKQGISLEHGKEYGWLKVYDNSMDLAKPFGLVSGDYVLFCKQHEAINEDLVVVARPVPHSIKDPSYLIRRLNANSLHTDSSKIKDHPFLLDENTQILGVVTAIAKQFMPVPDREFSDEKLRGFLLQKFDGDNEEFEEILQAEKRRNPYAPEAQLLKNAILRWALNRTWLRFSEWSWFSTGVT